MMKAKVTLALAMVFIAVVSVWLMWKWNSAEPPPPRISGAYQALNFWSLQRAYPNKAIPDVHSPLPCSLLKNTTPRGGNVKERENSRP